MEGFCRRAGFEPHVVFEAGQLSTVLGLVLAGVGVTIVPSMAASEEPRRILVRDVYAYRDVGVVWRQGQPLAPAAVIFLDMLRRSAEADGRNHAPAMVAQS
jgi:LysR family hydrogen peroxide-inducible transcriptional activator